jgi:hypothetical protein
MKNGAPVIIRISNYTSLPAYHHTYKDEVIYRILTVPVSDDRGNSNLVYTKSRQISIVDITIDSIMLDVLLSFTAQTDTLLLSKGNYEISTTLSHDSSYINYEGLSMNVQCRIEVR